MKNGEIGEIFASGLNLAAGYVNGRDPERFLENPLAVEKSKFRRKIIKEFWLRFCLHSTRIRTSVSHWRLRIPEEWQHHV